MIMLTHFDTDHECNGRSNGKKTVARIIKAVGTTVNLRLISLGFLVNGNRWLETLAILRDLITRPVKQQNTQYDH